MQPCLIITTGATGSGKTGLFQQTATYLGVDASTFQKILIDDIIESDERYVANVKNIVQGIELDCASKCRTSKCRETCEKRAYLSPSDDLYEKFSTAYFISRMTPGCHGEKVSCEELLDINLKIAFKKRENVVFETNGKMIPAWILNPEFTPPSYTVVVSYSLVNIRALIDRNKTRAYAGVQTFKKNNYTAPAPRLPNVSPAKYVDIVNSIKKTLIDLYNSCILRHDSECGTHAINRLLLYDNNRKLTLVFDSAVDPPENFHEILRKLRTTVRSQKKKGAVANKLTTT